MRILLFFVLIALFSCKSKELTKEEKIQKAKEESQELVNKISAPLIANEVGELNILIETAKNQNLAKSERGKALDQIREKYCGFMCYVASFDSLYTRSFDIAAEKQKELIEAKWKNEAAKQVYKDALQHQQELEQKLNQ